MSLKNKVITMVPNIPLVIKTVTGTRINMLKDRLIPAQEVEKAEKDFDYKRRLVEERANGNAKPAYDRLQSKISGLIADGYAKGDYDEKLLRTEIAFIVYAYGFIPDEYFYYSLKDKGYEERRSYVSDVERRIYALRMNRFTDRDTFNDKGKTYELFHNFYKREAISVSGMRDLEKYRDFVSRHPVFVIKKVDESSGKTVERIDLNAPQTDPEAFFKKTVEKGKHILEEVVVQSGAMARINPDSVNTVRCVTIATRHGVVVPHCFFRTGRGGTFVDNANSGGIFVDVDVNNGMIASDGFNEKVDIFKTHPQTGVTYKGFQLPQWNDMIETCKEMTKLVPTMKYVSWDMAHTDRGWVIIEGNFDGQMVCQQVSKQHGIKRDIEAIIRDVDLII